MNGPWALEDLYDKITSMVGWLYFLKVLEKSQGQDQNVFLNINGYAYLFDQKMLLSYLKGEKEANKNTNGGGI